MKPLHLLVAVIVIVALVCAVGCGKKAEAEERCYSGRALLCAVALLAHRC